MDDLANLSWRKLYTHANKIPVEAHSFFRDLEKHNGEVRFFMKIRFFWDFFTKNHRRNHRKMILIDDNISYVGSTNISGHSLNWCESVLRLENPDLNKQLGKIFQN